MAETTVNWKDDSQRNHDIVYRFEKAFGEGKNPQVNDYLQGEGVSRRQLLVELLHSDLELRIRAGQSLRMQDHLKAFPELAQQPDEVASLLKTEIRCLRQMGIQPMLPKYQAEYGAIMGKRVEELFAQESRGTREAKIGAIIAGKYKLLAELGEGGMGSVYAAEQTQPVRRTVAIKLIKPGMDSSGVLARFEAERQALAMMDHPNIARMLDGGITEDGQPYFVMEQVKGLPITKFCDQEKLSLDDRIQLFMSVCQGVQHAHQKGIIHRDLKPSNILVTLIDGKPVPKVIDFGVAKALHQKLTDKTMYTEAGRMVGTLEYMAPEQADLNNLDVDTRADVYALGVVLYELLTGQVPFTGKELRSAAYDEMLRIIREMEPPRPSIKLSSSVDLPKVAALRRVEPKQLSSVVAGELDWIVMKCLEKERGRRYETANALGRELQRFLSAEPIEARPPSMGYRVGKFVRRNRGKVIAASLVLTALVSGIATTSWQMLRAIDAEGKAVTNKNIAEENAKVAKAETERANEQTRKTAEERNRVRKHAVLGALKEEELCRSVGEDLLLGRLWQVEALEIAGDDIDLAKPIRYMLDKSLLASGERLVCEDLHISSNTIKDIKYSNDGRYLVCTSIDNAVYHYDVTGKRYVHLPLDYKNYTEINLSKSSNQHLYYSVMTTGAIAVTRLLRCKLFAGSPDGRHLASLSEGNIIRIWSIEDPLQSTICCTHDNNNIFFFDINEACRIAFTVGANRDVKLWDIDSGYLRHNLSFRSDITSASFSPNGFYLVVAFTGGGVEVIDTKTGDIKTHYDRHKKLVRRCGFSSDSVRVVTASSDNTAKVWSADTGLDCCRPLEHEHEVVFACFVDNDDMMATIAKDNRVRVWDWRNNALVYSSRQFNSCPTRISPTGINGCIIVHFIDGACSVMYKSSHESVTIDGLHLSKDNLPIAIRAGADGSIITCYHVSDINKYHVIAETDEYDIRMWNLGAGSKKPFFGKPLAISGDVGGIYTIAYEREYCVYSSAIDRVIKTSSYYNYNDNWKDQHKWFKSAYMKGNVIAVGRNCGKIRDGQKYATSYELYHMNRCDDPVSDLREENIVFCGQIIDTHGSVARVSKDEVMRAYLHQGIDKGKNRCSIAGIAAWRKKKISSAMSVGNIDAAMFHQNWLLAEAVLEAAKVRAK